MDQKLPHYNAPKYILPVIVLAQFFCTSLWFASNGVIDDLVAQFQLPGSATAHLTSAVQFGFITGTLCFALLTIADRFSPSGVFLVSALLAGLFNATMIWSGHTLTNLLVLRFGTGFFLAGIYPVGMKIAADYFQKGLGLSLGYLVGALVVGTAFPHLLNSFSVGFSWQYVLLTTTALAWLGGIAMILLVPDGPYRKPGLRLDLSAFLKVFSDREFSSAAFGYFGHMWELYAFWAFVPFLLSSYADQHQSSYNLSWWSFWIIAVGGLACVIGGYISLRKGTKNIASKALTLSGLCCLLSPLMYNLPYPPVFIGFLLFWGMVVIADSPLFSTLVAGNANPEIKGTALTIVNCVGFAITIISIQLIQYLITLWDPQYVLVPLALGPLLGLWALHRRP